jgi:hypothetical protein
MQGSIDPLVIGGGGGEGDFNLVRSQKDKNIGLLDYNGVTSLMSG